jgi:hypothetical protein
MDRNTPFDGGKAVLRRGADADATTVRACATRS